MIYLLRMYLLCQLVPYEFNDFSVCHHIENAVAGENEELKFFLLTDYHIWYRYKSKTCQAIC